jgi:hypothetical protein
VVQRGSRPRNRSTLTPVVQRGANLAEPRNTGPSNPMRARAARASTHGYVGSFEAGLERGLLRS